MKIVVILDASAVLHINPVQKAGQPFLVNDGSDLKILQNFVGHHRHDVFSTQKFFTLEDAECRLVESVKDLLVS